MNNLERSDKVIKPDYASRGSSEFYRHGKGGAADDEESFPRGDLSRLRQSLGPEPEVVHLPQPTRRVGWFVSGFIIASALGIVIGAAVIIAFPIAPTGPQSAGSAPARVATAGAPSEPAATVRAPAIGELG
jgi:hypothetical protein